MRPLMVVLAARLQVQLPAVAADGHLHDLGGALVDGGDAHVPADFLPHAFVGAAVAPQPLDASVGSRVARLGGPVPGAFALGIHHAFDFIDPQHAFYYPDSPDPHAG